MNGGAILRDALLRAVAEQYVRPHQIEAVLTALQPLTPYVLAAKLTVVGDGNILALVLQWCGLPGVARHRWVVTSWPYHIHLHSDYSTNRDKHVSSSVLDVLRFWVYDDADGQLTLEDVHASEVERRLDATLALYTPVRGETLPADGWAELHEAVARVPMPFSPRDEHPAAVVWLWRAWRWLIYSVVACRGPPPGTL